MFLVCYAHDNIEVRKPGVSAELDRALADACDTAADKAAAVAQWQKECRCRAMKGDVLAVKDDAAGVRALIEMGVCVPANADAATLVSENVLSSMRQRVAQYAVRLTGAAPANPAKRLTAEEAAARAAGIARRLGRLDPLRQHEQTAWRTAATAFLAADKSGLAALVGTESAAPATVEDLK